jgi:hypothetical protein
MSNEIVKYSNQFNAQALRKFTALDRGSVDGYRGKGAR